MNIEYREIVSVESPDKPHPWYVVDVDGDEVLIQEDKDGGRDAGLQNTRTQIPDHVDLPDASAVSESGDVDYAVTKSGEFVSFDPAMDAEKIPDLRAHLAFYDFETDTLTLLKFVER